ncbi:MAG: PA2778 family cysteine peptidase [Gammaproteobacteria bacterium]|nr:PA2778 family cysteine peptidase [Gammaproteobacteria bacterium]
MQPASFQHLTLAFLFLLMTGCAAAPQSAALLQQTSPRADLPATALLDSVPFYPQEDYQCGPAALATVLQASRVSVTPDALVSQVYVPARQGSLQIEMLAAPRRYGRVPHVLPPDLEGVLREVQSDRPVLVMQNLGLDWYPQWHYAVVVGYDLNAGEVILRSGLIRDYRLALSVFERTWQRAGHWAVLVLPPGELPLQTSETAYFDAVTTFESAQSTARLSDVASAEQAAGVGEAWRAGVQRWPESEMLGMGYGNHAYGQGALTLAAEAYQQVLAAHPDYAAAHNNLAQVLLEQGHFEEAETHARRAVELGGEFAETYRSTLQKVVVARAR